MRWEYCSHQKLSAESSHHSFCRESTTTSKQDASARQPMAQKNTPIMNEAIREGLASPRLTKILYVGNCNVVLIWINDLFRCVSDLNLHPYMKIRTTTWASVDCPCETGVKKWRSVPRTTRTLAATNSAKQVPMNSGKALVILVAEVQGQIHTIKYRKFLKL